MPAVLGQAFFFGGKDGSRHRPRSPCNPHAWLHRTPPIVTSRACLCRCAFVSRSHVGRVVFTSLQHDEGVSKRLEHPLLALVRELLVQIQNGWMASSSVCVDATLRRFACARLSSYFQPNILVDVDLTSDALFVLAWPLSPTTTVCDEARGRPPNVIGDDQARVNPHRVVSCMFQMSPRPQQSAVLHQGCPDSTTHHREPTDELRRPRSFADTSLTPNCTLWCLSLPTPNFRAPTHSRRVTAYIVGTTIITNCGL